MAFTKPGAVPDLGPGGYSWLLNHVHTVAADSWLMATEYMQLPHSDIPDFSMTRYVRTLLYVPKSKTMVKSNS